MALNSIREIPVLPICPQLDFNGSTNTSVISSPTDPTLAPLHQLVAGLVVFLSILPFVLFHFRFFPLGTNAVLLLGAFLMVATAVVTQDEVYHILGGTPILGALFLLIGMMVLLQYIERELLLLKLIRKILRPGYCFENYLWRVTLMTFLFSALFTSDATVAIITPLVLKYWEAQERSRQELQTLVMGIATSATIGSVMTILGSPQMALIAAKTSTYEYHQSRLDMKRCLIYFALPALVAYFINLGFLLLHFRIRNMRMENGHLVSEPSQSDQEMTGLTGSPQMNGHVRRENGDVQMDTSVFRDDRLPPCQLETIPEDEILEIQSVPSTSHSDIDLDTTGQLASTSHRNNTLTSQSENNGVSVTVESPSDSDENDVEEGTDEHLESHPHHQQQVAAENVSNPSLDYRPSALTLVNLQEAQRQLQRAEASSIDRALAEQGWRLSKRLGIYRSLSGVSAIDFLPYETGMQQLSQVDNTGGSSDFSPVDSRSFHVVLCLLVLSVVALLVASTQRFPFDIGLVPMAAAGLAVMFDSLINRRPSMGIVKRLDFSVFLTFMSLSVWLYGFNKTQVPNWIWTKAGLANADRFDSVWHILLLTITVITTTNLFGGVITTVVILERLVPCQNQLPLVLYLAWCSILAGNFTQLSNSSNLIVSQKALQVVNYRLTYWTYLKYGFLTTLVLLPLGILMLYCLILIPV